MPLECGRIILGSCLSETVAWSQGGDDATGMWKDHTRILSQLYKCTINRILSEWNSCLISRRWACSWGYKQAGITCPPESLPWSPSTIQYNIFQNSKVLHKIHLFHGSIDCLHQPGLALLDCHCCFSVILDLENKHNDRYYYGVIWYNKQGYAPNLIW